MPCINDWCFSISTQTGVDAPINDTAEQVYISSLALLKVIESFCTHNNACLCVVNLLMLIVDFSCCIHVNQNYRPVNNAM